MLDALIALVGALEAHTLPGVAGILLGVGLGVIDDLLTAYRRNKAVADSGAAQQRAINDAAETAAEATAGKVTDEVDAMDADAVAAALARRLSRQP